MNKKLLGLTAAIAIFLTGCGEVTPPPPAANYDKLAQCLTEKGVKMYGAFWCPHCTNQKKMFGDSFKYITYVECAEGGENAQPEACAKAGIESYPTWYFPGQDKLTGEKTVQQLAERSNCLEALNAQTATLQTK